MKCPHLRPGYCSLCADKARKSRERQDALRYRWLVEMLDRASANMTATQKQGMQTRHIWWFPVDISTVCRDGADFSARIDKARKEYP